jgi:hypothetical protein
MTAPVDLSSEEPVGRPRPLFTVGPDIATDFDVSPDGQRFLMIRSESSSRPTEIRLVLNWFEDLKRLVPTN